MCLASHEAIVAVVKVERLVAEEVHGYESFAVVLVNLGVDAVFGHSANLCVKLLANLVGHKLNLLVLDAGALGVGCDELHVAAVLAQGFVFALARALCSLGVAGEQAVNHEVGIAADRRCEVRVVLERQSVVADVDGAVLRLHHGTERHVLDELLYALPFDI